MKSTQLRWPNCTIRVAIKGFFGSKCQVCDRSVPLIPSPLPPTPLFLFRDNRRSKTRKRPVRLWSAQPIKNERVRNKPPAPTETEEPASHNKISHLHVAIPSHTQTGVSRCNASRIPEGPLVLRGRLVAERERANARSSAARCTVPATPASRTLVRARDSMPLPSVWSRSGIRPPD